MKNLNLKIVSGLLLGSITSPCFAFTLLIGSQNQTTIGWKTKAVAFDIDTSCDAYRSVVDGAVNSAAGVWAGVPSSMLKVSIGSTVTLPHAITTYVGNAATSYAPAGNPIVYCDANFETNSGADADSIPGFATATNMDADGKLTGALLVLNVQTGGKANVTTLDATTTNIVLTHEIGHVLGLGHSADENALMYYSVTPGNKVVLAQDDMDGISYLYPRKEPFTDGFLACGAIKALQADRGDHGRGPPPPPRSGLSEFATLLLIFFAAFGVWPRRVYRAILNFT